MKGPKVYHIIKRKEWWTSKYNKPDRYLYHDGTNYQVASRSVACYHKFYFTDEEINELKLRYNLQKDFRAIYVKRRNNTKAVRGNQAKEIR